MSTKTLRKRIALATVAALGAGVLSLVSSSVANAVYASLYNVAPSSSAANPTPSTDGLNIASKTSTTGASTAASVTSVSSATSVGLLSVSDLAGTLTAGTTQTATLLSTGTLQVYTSATNGSLIVVKGGSVTGSNGGAASSDSTQVAITGDGVTGNNLTTQYFYATIKPNSGVTSMTVALYAGTTNSTTAANLISGASTGSLTGYIIVTVASTSTAGTYSAANSGIYYEYSVAQSTAGSYAGGLTADVITGGDGTSDWNTKQHANIRLKDAYGTVLAAGLLTATATNGAYVALTAAAADGTPTATSAYYTSAPDNTILSVVNPGSAPLSTVVTISYNGTVVGTKAFTFTGEVAKIVLSGAVNGKLNQSTSNTASISFLDAAGNAVYTTGTNTPSSGFLANSATYGTALTATSLGTAPTSSSVPGYVNFTCAPVAGSTNLSVKYVNISGTVVTSNTTPVSCAGPAVSYTAAYDKSTYKPGEIATLKITFKDSKGNLASDNDLPALTNYITVGTAGVATSGTVSGPSSSNHYSDVTTNGVLTYKYAVGTTTGSFTNVITVPDVNNRAAALSLTASAPTVTLNIADGSTSLNDVLKGIVDLIASINKQIAALVKLVTKKK